MMIDENLARLRAHRNNISRYGRLLRTHLTVLERDFIEQRLSEEVAALNRLASNASPLTLTLPDMPARRRKRLRPLVGGSIEAAD
jgi:hypothetical protein